MKFIESPGLKFKKVGDELLDAFGKDGICWFERAASGLLAVLSAIRNENRSIIPQIMIPALGCTTVANCVILSGCEVVFVDVEPETGVMDYDDLAKKLTPSCKAVIAVALYGNTNNPEKLLKLVKQNDLILIEDAAQAQRAVWPNGEIFGGYGDFAILSFNATKIFEAGGAVLLYDKKWHDQLKAAVQRLPDSNPTPESLSAVGTMIRDLQMGMAEAMRKNLATDFALVYPAIVEQCIDLYCQNWRMKDENSWLAKWDKLPANLSHRRQMAAIYDSNLDQKIYRNISRWRDSQSVWRYTVLAPSQKHREKAVFTLRENGFLASSHYWALPPYYYPNGVQECANARKIALSVINLWVDGKVSAGDVEKICSLLNEVTK